MNGTAAHLPPGRTALVIDDDEDFREVARELLTRAGCRVLEAGTGTAGLALLDAGRPDMVILDINLPDGHGLDVCKGIRLRDRTIPILLCTALTTKFCEADGLAVGATGFLLKPFQRAEFLERVSTALRLR